MFLSQCGHSELKYWEADRLSNLRLLQVNILQYRPNFSMNFILLVLVGSASHLDV